MIDPDWFYLFAATLPIIVGLALILWAKPLNRWANRLSFSTCSAVCLLSLSGLVIYQFHVQFAQDQSMPMRPWTGSLTWMHLSYLGYEGTGNLGYHPDTPGIELRLGYRVDRLTTVLFVIVAILSLVISFGSRNDEQKISTIACHSCLTGVLFHLLLADNLLQLFICLELFSLFLYLMLNSKWNTNGSVSDRLHMMAFRLFGSAAWLTALTIFWTTLGTISLVTVREEVHDVLGNLIMEDGQPRTRIDQLSISDAIYLSEADGHEQLQTGPQQGVMMRLSQRGNKSGHARWDFDADGTSLVIWNQQLRNTYGRQAVTLVEQRQIPIPLRSYSLLTLAGLTLVLAITGLTVIWPLAGWLPQSYADREISGKYHCALLMGAGVYMTYRFLPILVPTAQLVLIVLNLAALLFGLSLLIMHRDKNQITAYLLMILSGVSTASLGLVTWSGNLWIEATIVSGVTITISLLFGWIKFRQNEEGSRTNYKAGLCWYITLARLAVTPIRSISQALSWFDRKAGWVAVAFITSSVRSLARLAGAFEKYVLEMPSNILAKSVSRLRSVRRA